MIKKLTRTLNTRFATGPFYATRLDGVEPEKTLLSILPKRSGRDSSGQISARHHGGRNKRFYRDVDFRRDKLEMAGRVLAIEYDPNRNANLALVGYQDGQKRYILAPDGVGRGDTVQAGKSVEIKSGNASVLANLPVGTIVHNIELRPGGGGVLVRGAGGGAKVLSRADGYVTIKLPSGESRLVLENCMATVGMVSNLDAKNVVLGKAGRSRHLGIRPKVRGVAQNPRTHPHGGGEGRSGEGMKQAKTPWGKPARGLRTRKKEKYSDKYIVERRSK